MNKFAFVFPGQGSQSIGMLSGFGSHPIIKKTIAEASEVLGMDLGKLINEGPKEELDLTINTQPIMLTAAVACYRIWLDAGGAEPTLMAGHSLGEYSALVAAKALPFKEAVSLVRFRAKVMQEAVPFGIGGMAAILGLTDDEVRLACLESQLDGIVEPVNFNAPAQVVIAGHKAAVERACEAAKARGAKRALVLPVSAPFHSSLLKPASDQLREYLTQVPFSLPEIDVINNVDVEIASSVDTIKDALVRQAANPVRWVEIVQEMARQNVTHIVECGPGKVLAGLVKRINPDLVGEAMFDDASLNRILELNCQSN
ncbi:MAG: fabD [Solimicrobium sp.]|jgi:[acyl-carrier-protein] S-malonyltransferase|nr:fabD [Solimicrobium sp.]